MIEIGTKLEYVGYGIKCEVVSNSTGLHGGLVWLSWPTTGKQLDRGIEAYLGDDLDKLISSDVLRVIRD